MDILSTLLNNLNYFTVFILMLLESTVVPVPSELVVAPAAYHAAGGNLNAFLVVLFATLGADIGATINYLAGYYLGRPVIYRFANSRLGHLCLLNQQKVEKSEAYFNNHGKLATITIGAGVWNMILAVLGYYLHSIVPEEHLNDKIMEYGEYIKIVIIALVILAIVFFVSKKYLLKRKAQS